MFKVSIMVHAGWNRLVTRIMHAKYEYFIVNILEWCKLKFDKFDLELRQMSSLNHGSTEKVLSQGPCMPNTNALSYKLQMILFVAKGPKGNM